MYCEKNSGSKNRPNDGAFYSAWHYINSDPHHMTLGLFESQDAILLHILFSDYYLIYSFFDKPIFPKHRNIGTVFLPTVLLNSLSRALKSGKVHEATSKPELYRRISLELVLCSESVYIHQSQGKGYKTRARGLTQGQG